MKRHASLVLQMLIITASFALMIISAGAEAQNKAEQSPPSVAEARGRAKLLHETIHATLHLVHQQYYREDEGLELPAAALQGVFRELADGEKVELRWLVVDGQAMNVAHIPKSQFEKDAAKALASGQEEFELAQQGMYRRAGKIALTSECLKCHLPSRMSASPRSAGLIIAMPIESQ